MATAILRGCTRGSEAGGQPPLQLRVADPFAPARDRLRQTPAFAAVEVLDDNARLVSQSDVVIIAVKPQVLAAVLTAARPSFRKGALVVSIAAGVSTATLARLLPEDARIVRTMPNTPAMVLAGATAIAAGPRATAADVAWVEGLFRGVGRTVVVEERLLDAVTGLSGSGPAYVLMIVEALADGGVKMGLPRDIARTLALQTVLGTAQLALEDGRHLAELREAVTSPGGTTAAGLHTLENAAVRGALVSAVEAATRRSEELGRALADALARQG